ncbi:px domain containing protein [Sporothrix schenckii 1099-18]|uniref:PXA domain-containing protein n=2 Tax=Sporothrix schenckii TaxID=29908 RepID=U7PV06_SPOS1|nr:px domain containing protein [Sporothrix schenckii 1099-18]ERS99458.1 hypothetical protein HMPREF1624_04658 [Sporothrix schenckii ATCC 58251]KJR82810.1 px domain containing protein [Sporothrix schenckii 1099-18]
MDDRKISVNDPDRDLSLDSASPTFAASSSPSGLSPVSSPPLPQRPNLASQSLSAPPSPLPNSPQSPSPNTKPGSTASDDDIPTRIFRFLSTATVESLSAVGVGLAATTYFVLGRVGLVLIGAFGGIALFVAWEARNPDVTRAIRGEASSDLLARVIEYRRKDQENGDEVSGESVGAEAAFDPAQEDLALGRAFENFRPETRQALNGLVEAVVRDYVKWWYQPIVPSDQSFPLSCRRVLTSFLVSVSNHLSRKRPADAFLDFLTNSTSIVIVLFSELATAFAEHAAQTPQQQGSAPPQGPDANPTISAADAIYSYLASNPNSNLANLLSQRQQASKFRMVADDLLSFLDRQCYDCDPARTFLREIAATSVLETTLQTCSKPEWINGWIVHLLEGGEPDFSQAIDVGMQTRTDAAATASSSKDATSNSATAHMHHASIDIDGNVGNIALPKSRRSSFEADKAHQSRRKESVPLSHKKQLSRADEEMEEAMEEMKRMNEMIAAEEKARRTTTETKSATEAEDRLADAMQHNADELGIQANDERKDHHGHGPPSPSAASDQISPKASLSLSGDESTTRTARTVSTPITPRSSTQGSPSQSSFAKSEAASGTAANGSENTENPHPSTADEASQFTSFDQLVPPAREEDESSDSEGRKKQEQAPPPLTLHNANVTIHDEPVTDKGRIKSRPAWDFLIQIEPANAHYPGWMIVRKYADFEKLHEVLRRIATISGATAFTEQHGVLPNWKIHTRGSLRGELERYVRDACWYQPLAESEGMKRFLEKDTNNMPAASKTGLNAFETMGKNMLDALSNAPKGVAEGGKVMVGGVTGVFGNLGNLGTNIGLGGSSGQKKQHASSGSLANVAGSPSPGGATTSPPASVLQDVTAYTNRLSVSTPPRMDSGFSGAGSRRSRDSMDSQRSSVVASQTGRVVPMGRRMSYQSQSGLMDAGANGEVGEAGADGRGRTNNNNSNNMWGDYAPVSSGSRGSQHNSRASSSGGYPRSPSSTSLSGTRLPMGATSAFATDALEDMPGSSLTSPVRVGSSNNLTSLPAGGAGSGSGATTPHGTRPLHRVATSGTTIAKQFAALTEGETRVAVELLFAVINELYTLSSAWNIRRTLLTAAKSFLLRPGNPSLASIQSLLQSSVLDANTTDAGMAGYLNTLRENTMPTDAERAAWPAEMTAEEKERLRVKARRLLIRSGVPAALMGVMGQSATSDALGRIFDCLQVEEVARGLIFGLMLQAARIVTH